MPFTPLPKAMLKAAVNYRGQRPALVREQFFRLAGRFTPMLIAEQDGLRFYVRTDDLGVGRVTFTDMAIERATLDYAFACLRALGAPDEQLRSGWFVDIGANIGTTSITAVAREMVAGAVCIEPVAENRALLERNAELNGVGERIRTLGYAVSDEEGTVTFERAPENTGDGRVRVNDPSAEEENAFGEADREIVEVPATTVDALAARGEIDLAETSLVWIDTQGHEAQILGGASTLLSSEVPVLAEFWPYGLRRADGLERFYELVASGFSEFVDIGTVTDPSRPQRRPVAELPQLTPDYGGVTFTDLLLLS